MTKQPEIMYKVTWTRDDGTGGGSALAADGSARELRTALHMAGYKAVDITIVTAAQGRHSAPEPPVDEPLVGEAARRVRGRLWSDPGSVAAYVERYSRSPESIKSSHADGVADSMFSDRRAHDSGNEDGTE